MFRPSPKSNPFTRRDKMSRSGFTMIELLIVIGLMVLLATITVTTINLTISGDKVRAASRQVQSYLEGARDRAIHAKAPRGVRFLLDPTNSRTVSSMVYIAPTDDWTQGTIQLEWDSSTPPQVRVVRGFDSDPNSYNSNNPTGWVGLIGLYQQGLLRDGARILIPNDSTGTWYTINTSLLPNYNPSAGSYSPPRLLLTTPYVTPATNSNPTAFNPAFLPGTGPITYRLQLPANVLPNQEPTLLPKGTVIDLDRCSKTPAAPSVSTSTLPASWMFTGVTPFIYTNQMDVMFSPRGTVIGTSAGKGLIHFYVAEQKDADQALIPLSSPGDKHIVSLFGRTGAISVHPVDLSPVDTVTINGTTVLDYFKFAETGEVAGK